METMETKKKNVIDKYLNTKKKKIAAGCIAGALIIGCGAYAIRDTSPDLVLNKTTVHIEYGKTYDASFKNLVKTKGLDKDDISYLKKNVKIKSNIKNEDQKDYPAVGKYKVTVKYKDETKTVTVKVKDTVAPELTVPENTEVVKGTDLSTFDFKSLMSATDLAQLNDIQIDYSGVDVNNAGEYTAKASVEDVNKNKTEKEFKVTVKEPVNDENTETTTEVQTDPTTGTKKTVVVTKPKANTSTSSSSSSNSTTSSNRGNSSSSSSKGNTSSSSSSSSSGSTSKPSTGGNTSSGSTGGNSSSSTPQKVLKTKYWAKCSCGWYCDTFTSSREAQQALDKHLDDNLWNDGHAHGNYGATQYWE